MKTLTVIVAIVLCTMCYATKVKKSDFEKMSYYIKAQGSPTGTGFEYVLYDSEGYTHTLKTVMDEKITVWSYHAGGSKNKQSSLSWDIYPKKVKSQIKKDQKLVDGFYTYINKAISSKIKIRR